MTSNQPKSGDLSSACAKNRFWWPLCNSIVFYCSKSSTEVGSLMLSHTSSVKTDISKFNLNSGTTGIIITLSTISLKIWPRKRRKNTFEHFIMTCITIRKGSILNNIVLISHLCFNSALWSENWAKLQLKCFENLLQLSNWGKYRFCSILKKHWFRHRYAGKYLKSNGVNNSAWVSVALQQHNLIWTFNMENVENNKKRVQRILLRQILELCIQSGINALKVKILKDNKR